MALIQLLQVLFEQLSVDIVLDHQLLYSDLSLVVILHKLESSVAEERFVDVLSGIIIFMICVDEDSLVQESVLLEVKPNEPHPKSDPVDPVHLVK